MKKNKGKERRFANLTIDEYFYLFYNKEIRILFTLKKEILVKLYNKTGGTYEQETILYYDSNCIYIR